MVKLGGLHIIGTERHNRRIDNQLRGRADGRRPGSSGFVAMGDLMRLFGGRPIVHWMERLELGKDAD